MTQTPPTPDPVERALVSFLIEELTRSARKNITAELDEEELSATKLFFRLAFASRLIMRAIAPAIEQRIADALRSKEAEESRTFRISGDPLGLQRHSKEAHEPLELYWYQSNTGLAAQLARRGNPAGARWTIAVNGTPPGPQQVFIQFCDRPFAEISLEEGLVEKAVKERIVYALRQVGLSFKDK